jgi:hypothetical protein
MSRSARIPVLVVAFAVLSPGLCRADDAKADLRLRFEQGKTYALVLSVQQSIRQLVDGQEQHIAQTVKIGQTFKVEDIDADGVATIKVTFGPLAMRTQMGELGIEYDSDNPPDEILPAARPLAAMVGRSFTLRLKPDGTLVELKGVDAMLEAALGTIALTDAQKERLRASLEQQFGDEALKELMTSTFKYLPDEPVGVGDTWTSAAATERGYPAVFETVYKLLARKDGVATIEAKTKITSNPEGPPQKMGAATVRYKLEGTQEGTFEIDEATGWYVGGKLTQKVQGEMMVSGLPGQAEGEEEPVPIIIESTIALGTR